MLGQIDTHTPRPGVQRHTELSGRHSFSQISSLLEVGTAAAVLSRQRGVQSTSQAFYLVAAARTLATHGRAYAAVNGSTC